MTNANIIFNESIRLMQEGKLKGTGQFIEVEKSDGTRENLELPEEIHTFNGWKARGYQVRKGEKSSIKFPIWKYTTKKKDGDAEEDQEQDGHMFMKLSAFFTPAQVDPIRA